MVQKRFSKLHGLLCLLVALLLVPTGASPQAQPATGKAKVDRLVMGLINPYRDYMRPWINGTPDHNIQHDPAFEWLFEVDVSSGRYNPWLAKSRRRTWALQLERTRGHNKAAVALATSWPGSRGPSGRRGVRTRPPPQAKRVTRRGAPTHRRLLRVDTV